jgi:excinuclease ABC subunit B
MYEGDRSRKKALVEYGFRLPSAFDNRPLTSRNSSTPEPGIISFSDTGALRAEECLRVGRADYPAHGLVDPEISVAPPRAR